MTSSQKNLRRFIQILLTFCMHTGPLCFLFISCSTFITILLLWARFEIQQQIVKKNTVSWTTPHQTIYLLSNTNHQTLPSKIQVTKSFSEVLQTVPLLNEDIILFNRVPNSGSDLLVILLQRLEDYNGFKHVRLPCGPKHGLNRYEQEKLVNSIVTQVRSGYLPHTFDCHVFFVNFSSFGRQSPTYLNLVRDPIDRAIARFHLPNTIPPASRGNQTRPTRGKKMYPLIKEFEECVDKNHPPCTFKNGEFYELTIPYFCGHERWCMLMNDKRALEKAKQNVDKYYPVVGILEDLNTTLTVLQNKLPYFFRKVVDLFRIRVAEKNRIKGLQRPSKMLRRDIKRKLQNKLETEYEFYEWLTQRLIGQFLDVATSSQEIRLVN